MRNRLWNLTKNKFYEDLAKSLINSKNVYEDGSIGWAREANLSVSSPMNTAEVLLGLLYSSNVITQGNLSVKIRKCVKGGVKFLTREQCESGGWTTSESNNQKTAQGNIMTTSMAIWSIVEYVILHDDLDEVEACLAKGFEFIKKCKLASSIYKFRPASDKYSNMSTLYALMGLVNLNIYYAQRNDEAIVNEIVCLIDEIMKEFALTQCSPFESMFLMMIVKKVVRFDEITAYKTNFRKLLEALEKYSSTLTEENYLNTYRDVRYIRENGEKTEFFYYTPAWVLSAISYGTATVVPYKDHLIRSIVNKYFVVQDDEIQVIVGERLWTWSTAQTLMAFSMYGATQSVGDFLNLEEENDEKSAFIVYGRNITFKNSIENCLKAIGIKPQAFNNNAGNTQSTLDAVINGLKKTAISIVLLTGDDEGKCQKKYLLDNDQTKVYEKKTTPQPRMNVVFEAGYSYALRNNKNTIIISTNTVRPFTDLDGINKLILDVDKHGALVKSSVEAFKDKLVDILNNCGCHLGEEAKSILKGMPIQI